MDWGMNFINNIISQINFDQCTEVHFSSFFSGGFITAIIVNPPERKLAKRTSLQCWTIGAIFTFGRSRIFGPEKLRPLAVGLS